MKPPGKCWGAWVKRVLCLVGGCLLEVGRPGAIIALGDHQAILKAILDFRSSVGLFDAHEADPCGNRKEGASVHALVEFADRVSLRVRDWDWVWSSQ